jgi:tetratricopeptide (TPR) repeat protein
MELTAAPSKKKLPVTMFHKKLRASALTLLDKSDHLRPDDALTLARRGAAKLFMADFTGALTDIDRADRLTPNDAYTLKHRGATKCRLKDYAGAFTDFDCAVRLKPNDAFTLGYRGITKFRMQDYAGALKDFEHVRPCIAPSNIIIPGLLNYLDIKVAECHRELGTASASDRAVKRERVDVKDEPQDADGSPGPSTRPRLSYSLCPKEPSAE